MHYEKISDMERETLARVVKTALNTTHSIDFLTERLRGRSGGLRPSKPGSRKDDGMVAYVWRMARFHSGHDPSMPVTAVWDLTNWVEGVLDRKVYSTDPVVRELEEVLEPIIDTILIELEEDPMGATRRWASLISSNDFPFSGVSPFFPKHE